MTLIPDFLSYAVPFLVVLTVLIFVHELGHYWVARRNGVRVEVFSIGFGPELFGFNDRAGTRWKFSAIPLGGYVKMFGDENAASAPRADIGELSPAERAASFHNKRVGQRAAIVLAGPLANFLFSIVAMAILFATTTHPLPPAVVGEVQPDGPAAEAGVLPGDDIESINGQAVDRFGELPVLVHASGGQPITLGIERDGETIILDVTPALTAVPLADGTQEQRYLIGVRPEVGPYGLGQAVAMALTETVDFTRMTLVAVGDMLTMQGDYQNIGGPLRIAQISGDVANDYGPAALIWFMALLSINLGLINLFPVPVLDGGHLLYYAVEAVRGRPLGQRAQEFGFRIGLVLVLFLMLFATWNDLDQLLF